tara:strand:+ start:169 stop:1299 length:1131 start_codon:yes stop_codon:yes gene_type:complete
MKKKLTLVLVATTAYTINVFMLNNIKKLSKHYNVLIFCNNALSLKKLLPKSIVLNDINFKRQPSPIIDLITFLKLLCLLIKNKPDLTISISPKAGFITALSSFISRVPYRIHWFTGQVWVTKKKFIRNFYKILDRIIFNLCHHVLVDSHSQRKFLLLNNIISKNRSTVLLKGSVGGVNIKKFKYKISNRKYLRKKLKISKDIFTFLYLGRINKDKGIIELIEAFIKVERIYKPVRLVLVGPIEDFYINKLIKNYKKVIYAGETLTPQKWFSLGDIFCLPSHREGFGAVVIEAGSCNLATLGSNIYGINDAIVEDETGFLHKVGSISDIKKKMLFVIKNKKMLKKFGQKSRLRVEKDFDENLISEKLLEFIKSIIKN